VPQATSKHLRIAGLVVLAIPILILLAFTLGELTSGELSGLQHVVQLVPLAVLGWLAWKRPWWGGVTLIAFALLLTGIYVVAAREMPLSGLALTLSMLFAPPLVAGILFVAAARRNRADTSERASFRGQ
jgi:hypothetical protein